MKNIVNLYDEKKIDDLLRMELKINNIDILNKYEGKYPNIYSVLKKILYIDEHEGKLPKLGIIFSDKDLSKYATEILYFENDNLDLSIRLSDGKNSFLWFSTNEVLKGIVLFDNRETDDYNTLLGAMRMNSVVFIYKEGKTKIFADGSIYIHENRKWYVKHRIDDKINRILELTDFKYPDIMKKLIEFAYYKLSPRKIGSTLVYLLSLNPEKINELDPPLKFKEYKINFNKKNHNYLVKNFLRQIDGATLILPNGDIWGTGVHLQYSKKSKEIIAEEGGTRHTSAKRFSFDYSNSIVIVTSEDGPVTIYSDGIRIPLAMEKSEFDILLPKMKRGIADEGAVIKSDTATCKNCGKVYRIEIVKTSILDRAKVLHCKICNEELYRVRAKYVEYKIIKK